MPMALPAAAAENPNLNNPQQAPVFPGACFHARIFSTNSAVTNIA